MENGIPLASEIWQDYGLDKLEAGMKTLFPGQSISLPQLLGKLMEGDVLGAIKELFQGGIQDFLAKITGMKNILIWILVLGIISALMTHFIEAFQKKQIADMSFYFIYLLLSVILLECFRESIQIATNAIENIVLFHRLLYPPYLLVVGIAAGGATVTLSYQILLFIIYGVESVFLGVVLPLVQSYVMLTIVNGIWLEEKLTLLIELLEKGIGWILKAAIGIVTGFSVFQAVITPMVDSVRTSALRKTISVIPGIGNAAEGAMELVLGSAIIIKNSVGIVLLILLLFLCTTPLIQIFLISILLKAAAAFIGIVSDKRITACTNRTGDAGMLLLRTVGSAMLLFLITIAIVATSTSKIL